MRADRIKKRAQPAIIDLPEQQWQAIEASCDISSRDDDFRRLLSRHIKMACQPLRPSSVGEVNGPELAKVKRYIKEIQKVAEQLNRILSRLTRETQNDHSADYAKHAIVIQLSQLTASKFSGFWNNVTTSPATLELIPESVGLRDAQELFLAHPPLVAEAFIDSFTATFAKACQSAVQSLPRSRGGRPKNITFDEIIATLAIVYKETTRRRPFSGTNATGGFFPFCLACLKAFAPQLAKGNHLTLSKRIQRILVKLQS